MTTFVISADHLNMQLGKFCLLRAERGLASSAEDIRCLSNSIQYGHYSLLRNSDNDIIAYVTWAKINKEAYLAMKQQQVAPKYDYEWDEGPLTLVLDVLVRKGWENFSSPFFLKEARKHNFICFLDKSRNSVKNRSRTEPLS